MSDPSLLNTERVLESRFGAVIGSPSTYSFLGDHDLYTPAGGRHTRLKWIAIYSDPNNSAECIVTIKWFGGSGTIYQIPFPAGYGAFMHASVREGQADEILRINLSANQTIYVAGIDLEEF